MNKNIEQNGDMKQSECNKLVHKWELIRSIPKRCSMSGDRGSGQHLDSCYGVDCQFCDMSKDEYVYVCKTCGMEKIESGSQNT